jgi:F-type H+-transporting ATPase subunit b
VTVNAIASALLAADDQTGWGTKAPIIPHPSETITGLVIFAILYIVVARRVVPRLEQIFAERSAAIEGGIAKAEEAQREAAEALAQYRAQLEEAHGEAARIRADAQAQGAQIIAEMREHAQREASRISEAAHAQIEADRQQAVVQLRHEVGRLASDLASRIVGESLDDDQRANRVIERYLDELDRAPSASGRGT